MLNHSHRVLRGRLFSKEKFKFNNLFHSVYLVFQKVCFLLPICLPCVICGSYMTRVNAVLWHSARQTFASLSLFTWLAYASIYCEPIATLNQNKRTRLLYLGDAQIITRLLILVQKRNTVNTRLADTSIIRTAGKSQAKINYRDLTEINYRYYGLSLMWTITWGPHRVRYKNSWLYLFPD